LKVLRGVDLKRVLYASSVCFELCLALLCHFCLVCRFSCLLLVLQLFLLLDDLLELFIYFWSSSCASWGLGFEISTLYFLLSIDSLTGRLRNQVVSTLV
jgi:hypothetical protein